MTTKTKRNAIKDHTLVAWALTAKVARWEPFDSGHDGELCYGGMRYSTELDEFGVPVLTEHLRSLLTAAIAKARGE